MNKLITILIIAILASCAPSRYVVPLTRREKAIGLAYGGAILEKDGVAMPAPLVSFSYAKGKTDKLTYFTAAQISPMFDGYFAGEIGALKEWKYWQQKKIGLTTNFVANVMTDNKDGGFNFFPQFDMNLYWHFKSDPHYHCDCPGDPKWKMFTYVGFQSHFNVVADYELMAPFDEDVILSPHFGYSFGTGKWRLSTELKWIQPWVDNTVHDPKIWNPAMNTGTFGGTIAFYHNFN